MQYSQEELHEAAEAVVKADEIRNNKELMKELEPYMKEKMMRIDKILSLKDLWDEAKKKLAEEESSEEMKEKLDGKAEEPEEKDKPKNGKDKGEDPLKSEKLGVAKS